MEGRGLALDQIADRSAPECSADGCALETLAVGGGAQLAESLLGVGADLEGDLRRRQIDGVEKRW